MSDSLDGHFGLLAVMVLLAPTALSGQTTGLADPVVQADMLYLAGEPALAFERLEDRLSSDPTDYDALWRAARAAVALGGREDGSRAQNAWLDPAILLAERAMDVRPEGLGGIYWHGVAAGRRAMNAAPSYAVELAQIVYDDAHRILAADSLHAGAHNMLGRLNYEVMSLSRIRRLLARTFMGTEALDETSWEAAGHHLRRAAELSPGLVGYHFDLARLHRKRDRREDAIRELGHVLSLPAVHPGDPEMQEEARSRLDGWDVAPDSLVVDPVADHAAGAAARAGDPGASPAEPGGSIRSGFGSRPRPVYRPGVSPTPAPPTAR